MKYHVGMRVEACTFETGYEGSWFEGIIVSCMEDYCEVMYEKFKTEDGDQPLVERTDYNLLRPRPPHTEVRNWAIGDLVEAYENDAWWRGVVVQVVLPAEQYYVVFPESKSEDIFHQSNLRVRQDWENGTWYVPSPSSFEKDRTGHATGYEQLADEMTHRLEVEAYRSVLRVFRARETLTWKTFDLLTDLRIALHVTNEEHLLELKKLKTSC